MRCFHTVVAKLFCSSLMFVCCTANTPEATSSTARSHASLPPQHLPQDYVENSAPKAPPNHDGGLERDAGLDADSAVPFEQAQRQGRIAEDDDGDGWILTGRPGERLHLEVHNLSDDTLLHMEFHDTEGRPLHFPLPQNVFAKDQATLTLELPRGDTTTLILLILSAGRPLDYRVHTEIF